MRLNLQGITAIVGKLLLVAITLEILLGGNGYLTKLHGFRLRELLFACAMVWVAARLLVLEPIRIPKPVWVIFGAFLATTAFSAVLGYFSGSRPGAILAELKPLSYFPMLLFFFVAIRDRWDVTLVGGLIVACGAIQAVAYLSVLGGAAVGILDYSSIYLFLRQSDEFIFRHNPELEVFIGFLYKGAFHIGVAALLTVFDPYKWTKVLAVALIAALALTLTRGLVAALVLTIAAGAILGLNWRRMPIYIAACILALGILFAGTRAEAILLGSEFTIEYDTAEEGSGNERSRVSTQDLFIRPTDSIRVADMGVVMRELDVQMVTIGNGLGSKIGARERIEMTYLELLYKQGIPGLALWTSILLWAFVLLLKVPRQDRPLGLGMFLAGLYVYFATITNTFLTGSIGMATVFMSLASLWALRADNAPLEQGTRRWYFFLGSGRPDEVGVDR
ncbi:MAG: hypothetical protein WBA73_00290 [Devosia sp.]